MYHDYCNSDWAYFPHFEGPSLGLRAIVEGSLEVKLPTICRDGKAEVGRVREEKSRSEKSREEKVGSKKMRVCEKVAKSRFTVFF